MGYAELVVERLAAHALLIRRKDEPRPDSVERQPTGDGRVTVAVSEIGRAHV